MIKIRNLSALLALSALTALPACSMFGGGSSSSAGSAGGGGQYSQSSYGMTGAPSSYNTASAGNSATTAPVSPDMIRQVQTKLQQSGDYKGRVDGVWGPMTERGVRHWQQTHNMNATGEIDMATLQSMDISTNGNQYGQNETQPTGQNNQADNNGRIPPTANYSTSGNYGNRPNYSSTSQPNNMNNNNPSPTAPNGAATSNGSMSNSNGAPNTTR